VKSKCLAAGPILQSRWQEKRAWTQEGPQRSESVSSRIGGGREGSLIGCGEFCSGGGVEDKSCIGISTSLEQISF